jgi:hypothetical protein
MSNQWVHAWNWSLTQIKCLSYKIKEPNHIDILLSSVYIKRNHFEIQVYKHSFTYICQYWPPSEGSSTLQESTLRAYYTFVSE